MPSALKRGYKHQRQRQAQKKTGEAYNFRTCRIHGYPPPIFLLSFLLPKPGIHSFKSIGNPLQNERDRAHPDLENLSFFFFLSPLFFSFNFFLLLHVFCSYFFFLFSLNSLHYVHLLSRELPQSVSDFPSSINTHIFPRSIVDHIYFFT